MNTPLITAVAYVIATLTTSHVIDFIYYAKPVISNIFGLDAAACYFYLCEIKKNSYNEQHV